MNEDERREHRHALVLLGLQLAIQMQGQARGPDERKFVQGVMDAVIDLLGKYS